MNIFLIVTVILLLLAVLLAAIALLLIKKSKENETAKRTENRRQYSSILRCIMRTGNPCPPIVMEDIIRRRDHHPADGELQEQIIQDRGMIRLLAVRTTRLLLDMTVLHTSMQAAGKRTAMNTRGVGKSTATAVHDLGKRMPMDTACIGKKPRQNIEGILMDTGLRQQCLQQHPPMGKKRLRKEICFRKERRRHLTVSQRSERQDSADAAGLCLNRKQELSGVQDAEAGCRELRILHERENLRQRYTVVGMKLP